MPPKTSTHDPQRGDLVLIRPSALSGVQGGLYVVLAAAEHFLGAAPLGSLTLAVKVSRADVAALVRPAAFADALLPTPELDLAPPPAPLVAQAGPVEPGPERMVLILLPD